MPPIIMYLPLFTINVICFVHHNYIPKILMFFEQCFLNNTLFLFVLELSPSLMLFVIDSVF